MKAFRLDLTPEQAHALADQLQRIADAGLDHPSIVRPLAAGVEGTLAYAASEYVAAESLDIAVRHYAPAGLDMVLPFITQLAGAVDFARAVGIGHGALHPRDIFVTPDEARATGFGIVQALEGLGVRAPVRRPYTAPERVNGGGWDVAADVYSLGAIAFELFTGRRAVGADVESLGSNAGPHGDAVADALSRALADDPAQRYPSALAFAAALEASSRGERTTAAIEAVRAVASGALPAGSGLDQPAATTDVRTLTVHPDDEADVEVERDADMAESWGAERAPDTDREQAEPTPQQEPDPRADFEVREEEQRRETSLFDLDRDTDNGIPEVQHAGFETEPGWDFGRAPGAASETREEPARDDALLRREERAPGAAPVMRDERAQEDARVMRQERAPVPLPHRRERSSKILPVAVTLLLGLFVGFLAGYLVGARAPSDSSGSPTSTAPSVPDRAAEGSGGAPSAGARSRPRGSQTTAEAPPSSRRAQAPPTSQTGVRTTPSSPARSAAPAAAPARGRLVVRSVPGGAQVYVNGRRRGTTPVALRDLAAGTYAVRVTRDGFDESSQRVTVPRSGVREMTVRLTRRAASKPATFTGSLYVDSRPRGARVLLDGKEIGTTPMQVGDIRAGAHVVRLELQDHRTWTSAARVVAGEVVRVTGSLERIR